MGQKIHPLGFRLPVSRRHRAVWFAAGPRLFREMLEQDIAVRQYLEKFFARKKNASISDVRIERPNGTARITIFTGAPGIVIGPKGSDIEMVRSRVQELLGVPAHVNVEEVRSPETDAQLIADSIASQLKMRSGSPRRVTKRIQDAAMRSGAHGIKIKIKGRINGVEIARTESSLKGKMPLHSIGLDIRWGRSIAATSWGQIGVTVMIFMGQPLVHTSLESPAESGPSRRSPRGRSARSSSRQEKPEPAAIS